MIYLLIVGGLLLAAAAVWYLARASAHASGAVSNEERQQLRTVRDRLVAQLNELDIDERDRGMDTTTAAEERLRLESELAAVLKRMEVLAGDEPEAIVDASPRIGWRGVVVALALVVPLLAGGFYAINVSAPLTQLERLSASPAVPQAPAAMGDFDPAKMVARLEQRLKDNPDDAAGWARLGRSYVVLERIDDAKVAYENAYARLPKDFQAETPDALWFLGLAAFNKGEHRRALGFWNELLAQLPADSPPAAQLRQMIERAEKSGKK